MEWLLPFLVGAVSGAIGAALATRAMVRLAIPDPKGDDLAVEDVRLDAMTYGVGYLRKRDDGRLERVPPKLFEEKS